MSVVPVLIALDGSSILAALPAARRGAVPVRRPSSERRWAWRPLARDCWVRVWQEERGQWGLVIAMTAEHYGVKPLLVRDAMRGNLHDVRVVLGQPRIDAQDA